MGILKDSFLKALDKFDRQLYSGANGLEPLLHTEVIMNEVDAPYGIHSGRDNVITYLNTTQAKRGPTLSVDTNTLAESPAAPGSHGQVSGIDGFYRDNSLRYQDAQGIWHDPSTPFRVRYIFNLRMEAGNWLIINATATRIL